MAKTGVFHANNPRNRRFGHYACIIALYKLNSYSEDRKSQIIKVNIMEKVIFLRLKY